MKKNKSPEIIKLLKEALGIENANCSTCTQMDDVDGGVDHSSCSCLVCSINDGYGNLKSFPFKKEMKCWEPEFWNSKFTNIIKNGTDIEVATAHDSFKKAYNSVII